jgi:hypothetical protein
MEFFGLAVISAHDMLYLTDILLCFIVPDIFHMPIQEK